MIFMEGLSKPLKGLVKASDPSPLQEAIKRTLTLETFVPEFKFWSKPPASKKPSQKWIIQSKEPATQKGGRNQECFCIKWFRDKLF